MSIEREWNTFVPNKCGLEGEPEDTWDAAVAETKRQHWGFENLRGAWLHTCPDCRKLAGKL